MHIGHVITRLIIGGAQENTVFTVEGLVRKGHETDLITGPTEGPEGSLEDGVRRAGIGIIRIGSLIRRVDPFCDLHALIRLVLLFRRKRYDVIHTHSAKGGILGRIAARIASPSSVVVHTVHGLSFHEYQPPLATRFYIAVERFVLPFTDHFICVGEVMRERCLAVGLGRKDRYTVIYSGFPLRPYRESAARRSVMRSSLGIRPEEQVVGMIGRLFPLKGQDYLLSAFAEVARDIPSARLLLVGDGVLRRELEELAQRKGVAERVSFTGLVPPDRVPDCVAAMDILAHTSLREGLPKAVAQGFAGGKPVVAFDVDGARELVKDGETGFLIPARDTALLAVRLAFLLKNPAIAGTMGRNGQQRVEKLFAVETMVEDIERLYIALLPCTATRRNRTSLS